MMAASSCESVGTKSFGGTRGRGRGFALLCRINNSSFALHSLNTRQETQILIKIKSQLGEINVIVDRPQHS